eukprot:sb/3478143/
MWSYLAEHEGRDVSKEFTCVTQTYHVTRITRGGHVIQQEPTETSKQPIRTRYLGHVTAYQPIRDQYFLIRSVPDNGHAQLTKPRKSSISDPTAKISLHQLLFR